MDFLRGNGCAVKEMIEARHQFLGRQRIQVVDRHQRLLPMGQQARYLLRVDPTITHNAWLSYRFDRRDSRWFTGTAVRVGVNNVFDREPQLADEQYGYFSGSANPRGRQFTMEVSRKF